MILTIRAKDINSPFLSTVVIFAAFFLIFSQVSTSYAAFPQQSGDRVKVVGTLNLIIRSNTSLTGPVVGRAASGTLGTVVGGPTPGIGNTNIWWSVAWDNTSTVGYSVQNYLSVVGSSTSTPTSTTSTPSFNFSISNSGDASVNQGGSITETINTTLISGTTKSVLFSATGMPTGVSASFNPASCNPSCQTSMTLQASASTATGTYPIVITGTAGTSTHATPFNLTVKSSASTSTGSNFTFSLLNSGTINLNQGASTTQLITALVGVGTPPSVTFSTTGLPSGASFSFFPASCIPVCLTSMSLRAGASTPNGSYPITVSGVAGNQVATTSFNLNVTGGSVATSTPTSTSPSLTIVAPSGGERWALGSSPSIRWSSQNIPADSDISITLVNSVSPTITRSLASGLANDGEATLMIPIDLRAASYRVRIMADLPNGQQVTVTSVAIISVVNPTISVTSPILNQVWPLATTQTVTWTNNDISPSSNVTINLVNSSDLSIAEVLATDIPNTGSAQVFVPVMAAGSYKVQVVSTDLVSGLVTPGTSPLMKVQIPGSRILTPTTGSTWYYKNNQTIVWSATGTPPDALVTIDLILNDLAQTVSDTLTPQPVINSDGMASVTVPVPSTPSSAYRVKLTMRYRDDVLLTVASNPFSLKQAPLAFTAPLATSNWYIGTKQTVSWVATNTSPNATVKLSLIKTDAAQTSMEDLNKDPILNSGTAEVTVPVVPATNYKIKLTMTQDDETILTAVSAAFPVGQAPLTFLNISTSTTWILGQQQTVSWSATGTLPESTVKLTLINTDVGQTEVDTLVPETQNDGNASFMLPVEPLAPPNNTPKKYIVKLQMFNDDDELLLSKNSPTFFVAAPTLPILAPLGGENWTRGTTQVVRWNPDVLPSSSIISIDILNATTSEAIQNLATNQPNDGSASVVVPPDMNSGASLIELTATYNDQKLTTAISNKFNVVLPTINVIVPASGTVWYMASTGTVQWTNNFVPSSSAMTFSIVSPVGAEFLDNIAPLGEAGNNTGMFSNAVPPLNATGTYRIQVQATQPDDQVITGLSGNIQILQPTVNIIAPKFNDFWATGSVYPVQWSTSTLSKNALVSLHLVNADTDDDIATLVTDIPNSGFSNVLVPSDLDAGNVQIKLIATFSDEVISNSYSDAFNLRTSHDFTAPKVTPLNQSVYVGTSPVSLGVTATDDKSGIASVTWQNEATGEEGNASLSTTANGGSAWFAQSIGLAPGQNVIKFYAHDTAGNIGIGQIYAYIFDRYAPFDVFLSSDVTPFGLTTSSNPLILSPGKAAGYLVVSAYHTEGSYPIIHNFTWSVSGLPTGVAAAFFAPTCLPTCPNILAIQASSTAQAGTYPITVRVTGAGLTRTITIQITILSRAQALLMPQKNESVPASYEETASMVNTLQGVVQALKALISGVGR